MAAKERRRPGVLGRLLRLAAVFWQRILLATLLGVATVASNVGLMSTAAFIIARAALQPSIAELQIAIVGVRFFGIVRGLFRYSERLVSHDVNLRLLARLRVWFYEKLEPLAPARLMHYRSGDLLARIVADVETLEDLFVRVLAPPLVALAVMVGMGLLVRPLERRFGPGAGGGDAPGGPGFCPCWLAGWASATALRWWRPAPS